jgi:hypothetical protein
MAPDVLVTKPVDWNCNKGNPEKQVSANINGDIFKDAKGNPVTDAKNNVIPVITPLPGYDDWNHLRLKGYFPAAPAPTGRSISDGGGADLIMANSYGLPSVEGLSAGTENGSIVLSWVPLEQSRVIGYRVTRADASGRKSVQTVFTSRYLDPAPAQAGQSIAYDVQGLYLPHGNGTNLQWIGASPGGTNLRIGNAPFTVPAESLDPAALDELKQLAGAMQNPPPVGDATVVLLTPAASIVVQ